MLLHLPYVGVATSVPCSNVNFIFNFEQLKIPNVFSVVYSKDWNQTSAMSWFETWFKSGFAEQQDDNPPQRPEDSELFMVHSTMPPHRFPPTVFNRPPREELPLSRCSGPNIAQYTVIPSIISSLCFIFGIFYCFFGESMSLYLYVNLNEGI